MLSNLLFFVNTIVEMIISSLQKKRDVY